MELETEWAQILKGDDQLNRSIWNYIMNTYQGVKGSEFEGNNGTYKLNSYNEFLNEIIDVAKHLKELNAIDLEEAMDDLRKEGVLVDN